MKKIIGIMSILLACAFLFACSNGNQAQVKLASKKVSGGLDKMISQVKKLEDVNTDKMDLTSLLSEDMDTSDGYHCYNNDCYYCENGDCYRCKDYQQIGNSSNTNGSEVSTGRRNVRRSIYPYREVLNFKTPTKNHMTQTTSANLFANNDYRATKQNLNLSNGNRNYNDLRTACNNVCNLNKEYSNTKTSLINNCNQAKQLLERLKNGEAKLSDSDVKTLNSYYEVIKQCTNNISSCKSCKSTVNTIGKKKLNLASNSGSMTADYRNVYNCLDTNCNACNNANNSVLDLISFANKLLGEKQDEAMLGSNNTNISRYNSARNQFNRNRYATQNSQSKYPYQNGVRNNYYSNNNQNYSTTPYTRDFKTTQRYNENDNTTSAGGTTISSEGYEKSVSDNSTKNTTQNNSSANTKNLTTNTQNSNNITNFSSNNTTYTKNNNAINNSNYSANKSTTYNSNGNYQNASNKNNSIYNNSNYNSNNLNKNNTTNNYTTRNNNTNYNSIKNNTTRNTPRVNYYAPTTRTLKTNVQSYVQNFEPMPLEPQQCEKPLAYGPKQVRA